MLASSTLKLLEFNAVAASLFLQCGNPTAQGRLTWNACQEARMKRTEDPDVKLARGLLLAVAALLATTVLGFYLTGPVNKVSVMANATVISQSQ
jgi:hypothetical protein